MKIHENLYILKPSGEWGINYDTSKQGQGF